MFNFFSLKDMYDDQVWSYLLIISLCKWFGILLIVTGFFLAIYFNNWLAIIGGIFIVIIGFFATIVCHYLRKKLGSLATKGGDIINSVETVVKKQAKDHLNNIINKNNPR